jgi:phage tail sheath protein FI
MGNLVSPGINVVERNFSQIVPSVASGVGGMVGRFTQGPINTPILLSSETDLVNVFGLPTDLNANEWHTIAEFFKYTNACWVTRASNAGVLNATVSGTGVSILNPTDYENIQSGTRTTAGNFIAKQPGTVGNGIGVMVIDNATWAAFVTWADANTLNMPNDISLDTYFSGQPSTTPYVKNLTVDAVAKNDEVHVLIVDVLGKVSGVPYTILEKFEGLSKASDAVDYRGLSIYYPNVLNISSAYIWWSSHPTATAGANDIAIGSTAYDVAPANKTFAAISVVAAPNFYTVSLTGGVVGTASTATEIQTAYDTLANKDLYNVNLLMTGAFGLGTVGQIETYALQNIAFVRQDCVAFVSPHTTGAPIRDSATANVTVAAFKTAMNVPDDVASYGFMDTGMKYIFDRYSKKYRWIPLNGDMAGLAARTESTNDAWWSFAGYNRGGVKNVIKLAYNPVQAHRDYLYPKGINPVIIDAQSGPLLFGDRTMTSKPSAFDRINVRRLFIVLEKSISTAAKWELFEFNDAFSRSTFTNMLIPFLNMVQGRRGITAYKVICDSSNNTPQVIDSNQFVAEIFVAPSRSTNFITLSFAATNTGVAFSTVVGGQ